MNKEEKKNNEKMFQEDDFPFPFKKCKKIAEMIRTYCAGEGGMVDCCSMMRKMMGCGKGGEATNPGAKP